MKVKSSSKSSITSLQGWFSQDEQYKEQNARRTHLEIVQLPPLAASRPVQWAELGPWPLLATLSPQVNSRVLTKVSEHLATPSTVNRAAHQHTQGDFLEMQS